MPWPGVHLCLTPLWGQPTSARKRPLEKALEAILGSIMCSSSQACDNSRSLELETLHWHVGLYTKSALPSEQSFTTSGAPFPCNAWLRCRRLERIPVATWLAPRAPSALRKLEQSSRGIRGEVIFGNQRQSDNPSACILFVSAAKERRQTDNRERHTHPHTHTHRHTDTTYDPHSRKSPAGTSDNIGIAGSRHAKRKGLQA